MKQFLMTSLLLFLCILSYSQTKVIDNPHYEVRNTGLYDIAKIELNNNETRLTISCTYVPYWFLWFANKEVTLRDTETGKTYELKGMEGAVMEEKIWMKASGDSTIVLIYPPLEKSLKKFDFGVWIYGVSLDAIKAGEKKPNKVPAQVAKWLTQELDKVKGNVPVDFNSPKFFNKGTGRLVGCIKGYDRRLGFNTGLVYTSNELTREDYPTVVKIQPDGSFEADLPFDFPKYTALIIKDARLPFYLESGQTLSMIIDWEEFLIADRKRNVRYQLQNIEFQGPLAQINADLTGYIPEQSSSGDFQKKMMTMLPKDFKHEQIPVQKADMQKVEEYINMKRRTPQATAILRSKALLESADRLFDFVMNRDYYARQDTTNKVLKVPVAISYYDFLKEIPLNDRSLLVTSEFSTFVNRFEYCDPLMYAERKVVYSRMKPEKDFLAYLIEMDSDISQEDKRLISIVYKGELTNEERTEIESKKVHVEALFEKNKGLMQAYSEKYIKPLNEKIQNERYYKVWMAKDSILLSDLGFKNNLVYEISKVRSLKFRFENSTRETASETWKNLKTGITTPYLIETGNHLFSESFPEKKTTAYALPKGPATDVFRKIIDPFKGKILFIDFWATTCAPCVGGIKTMKPNREKYKDNKDFDFIFITDERGSPKADYDKFVAEQGMKNIYRLSVDDYNYLRQLFKFNGIPHYTVIDKQGNVFNNNFQMHNFESELKGILSAN